jgi:GntR family transcriptional regulator
MEIDKVGSDNSESPISFVLDGNSGMPTYLQLVQQVENSLRLGYLQIGDRLPRVKDVVASLAINPNTVLKSYKELESRGYVTGKQGIGTFVVASPQEIELKHFVQLQRSLKKGWLKQARDYGLNNESILALVQMALNEIDADVEATSQATSRELA